MVGICHVHGQRITESGNCLSERNAVLAEIRFCLFGIPLEIIAHESILPFSIEILQRPNAEAEKPRLASEASRGVGLSQAES